MTRKIFLCTLLGIVLSGCSASPAGVVEKRELFVYIPPKELFHCPKTPIDANPDSLRDSQVSVIIRNMNADNRICRNNIEAIEKSLTQAKKEFENE